MEKYEALITRFMILVGFVVAIIALYNYKNQELAAIKSNIEISSAKGIDPIAVRCAYAQERDMVCVAYAASKGSSVK